MKGRATHLQADDVLLLESSQHFHLPKRGFTDGGIVVVNRRMLGQGDNYIPGVVPNNPCWPEPPAGK